MGELREEVLAEANSGSYLWGRGGGFARQRQGNALATGKKCTKGGERVFKKANMQGREHLRTRTTLLVENACAREKSI